MPIMYVNPARGKRRRIKRNRRAVRGRGGRFVSATRKRRRAKRRVTTKGSSMAKTKRRRRRARRNPRYRGLAVAKRRAAARKGARTRAAKRAVRVAAGKKAARKRRRWRTPLARRRAARRKRTGQKVTRNVRRRRRNLMTFAQPNRRRKRRKNRARRRRRNSYFTLKTNPRRRRRRRSNRGRMINRARRRYGRRRNPGFAGLMGLVMKAAPVAASLYGARLLSGRVVDKIPGLDQIPERARGPVLAGGLALLGHILTRRVKFLSGHREGIMVGLGINFLDKLVKALSPDLAAQFGVSEYVAVDGLGWAPPIDDQITMGEYVAVGDYEQDLGVEQDLGAEEDLGMFETELGSFDDRKLGGVTRGQMTAPVGSMKYLAPVPPRSFTAPVPGFGHQFDEPKDLQVGMFAPFWNS